MMRREDSEDAEHERSNRMFEKDGKWFFHTREDQVIGPFADALEASTQLEVYIRLADAGMLPEGETFEMETVVMDRAV